MRRKRRVWWEVKTYLLGLHWTSWSSHGWTSGPLYNKRGWKSTHARLKTAGRAIKCAKAAIAAGAKEVHLQKWYWHKGKRYMQEYVYHE